jgi:hypothetical protein
MLTKEEKKHTLNEYFRHISHFSDKEYQRRIWIRREGPECQAFDDAVCDFFDIGDPIIDTYKEFEITDRQLDTLLKFRDEFRKFSETHDLPQGFIDSADWTKITEMAKKVLETFHYPEKV